MSGNDVESDAKRIVVIGNGMVGQRFIEDILDLDTDKKCKLVTFCEEPRAAYNRVKLTSYFETLDPSKLSLTSSYEEDGKTSWYDQNNVELFVGDKAVSVDTDSKTVTGASGRVIPYDVAVLATGSSPFVPPIPGRQRPGVFVYRTIEDLDAMISYVKENNVKSAAVIGGGLLGLEAAKAVANMNVTSHIIEFAPILMCRQIDQGGHNALVGRIEDMGLKVHCGARTESFVGTDGTTDEDSRAPVAALRFSNDSWDDLPVQMVVVSCGIKPRDEVARKAGLNLGERGGVIVDDQMKASAKDVYAIGEIALHDNFIYGLLAPGYKMAEVCAKTIAQETLGYDLGLDKTPAFTGADLSTKLKLLGCDVASFGETNPKPEDTDISEIVWSDIHGGVYRKLIFDKARTKLKGGILVGDASDYNFLHSLYTNKASLPDNPAKLLGPPSAAQDIKMASSEVLMDPNAQICSCNDVSRSSITQALANAIDEFGAQNVTLSAVKKFTRAGSGCGGCDPQIKVIMAQELKKVGAKLSNRLCEHFSHSRPELMALVRTDPDPKSVDTFDKIIAKFGSGDGCEVCKPTIANMLASTNNKFILDEGRDSLQDTNDRSLANMQRAGTYSVIPRVPGGELTPDKLIALGTTAKKYGLYSKITGAQRIGYFGAAKHQLPDIWEDLDKAGFESGHAYGKALRAVKSCVGSEWCRFGLQDSVSFAIRLENRYKGIRAPHKFKGAVAGCVRDCSEALDKDFGMVATEHGYNLYVGGNAGAKPAHAQLLAADIDEETVIKYLDRYLMYYILTADKLERTAVWQSNLPKGKNGGGPIEHLKEVIIEDSLGICEELDQRMQLLVETYCNEWKEVIQSQERRNKFKQFVNTDKTIPREDMIEYIDQRGQKRPADWPADGQPQTNWRIPDGDVFAESKKSWVNVGKAADFTPNAGSTILVGDTQLAVFNNANRREWYCTQNMCPHKQAFVLSQGIMGEHEGMPKVACPIHKKKFGLKDGVQMDDGGDLRIITFPTKVDHDGNVLVELPEEKELDAILGTNGLRVMDVGCELEKEEENVNMVESKPENRRANANMNEWTLGTLGKHIFA